MVFMSSCVLWVCLRLNYANLRPRQMRALLCSCTVYNISYYPMMPQSVTSDFSITSCLSHPQQNINIFSSTKLVFISALSLYCAFCVQLPVFLVSCFKNTAHSVPRFNQGCETYPRFEMTSRSLCATSPLVFHQVCMHRFMLYGLPSWLTPFGLTAMLMRQLKFLALASLRGDQFRPLASGGRSLHSLLPA